MARVIKYEDLEKTARKVKERAYLAGEFPTRKIRRKPRDPEELAMIAKMASYRIRKNPLRMKDGKLIVPRIYDGE